MNTIGRAEKIDIPVLALAQMPAKIDTGAFSSSIDCSEARVVERDSRQILEFIVLRPGREGYTGDWQSTEQFDVTEVRNSNGTEQRYVIFIEIALGGKRHSCRLTLANRHHLRYPVLIGRQFLREAQYIVDVSQGNGLAGDEEERLL
jgi:hypothetical protein